MVVTLGSETLFQYRRFSLYNSPYVAHGSGRAIDLYPDAARDGPAPSPVAGEVLETRTVDAPPKHYAVENDHLIAVDAGDYVARILHVRPGVEPGDVVDRGDSLGRTIRSGFFAPWVDDHLHVGFREHGDDYRRASGSLPIAVDVPIRPLSWDGTGTVVETGDTYVVLDAPAHPDPGECFAGIAASVSTDDGHEVVGVLDGGLDHYDGGGLLGDGPNGPRGGSVRLRDRRVGTLVDDRTVRWDDVTVRANGEAILGLSLFVARDAGFGAKLVCPEVDFERGERVAVTFEGT